MLVLFSVFLNCRALKYHDVYMQRERERIYYSISKVLLYAQNAKHNELDRKLSSSAHHLKMVDQVIHKLCYNFSNLAMQFID